jgi:hypothetical protein
MRIRKGDQGWADTAKSLGLHQIHVNSWPVTCIGGWMTERSCRTASAIGQVSDIDVTSNRVSGDLPEFSY